MRIYYQLILLDLSSLPFITKLEKVYAIAYKRCYLLFFLISFVIVASEKLIIGIRVLPHWYK